MVTEKNILPFYELKGTILKELSLFKLEEPSSLSFLTMRKRQDYLSLSIPFRVEDGLGLLQNLAQFSQSSPLCYFKSKHSHREDLALGSCQTFRNDQEMEELSTLIQSPDLIFFGGRRFDFEQKTALEWHEFGQQFYFLPRVWINKTDEEELNLTLFFNKNDLKNNSVISSQVIFDIESLLNFTNEWGTNRQKGEESKFLYDRQVPAVTKWESNIKSCLFRLKQDLEKVVMSRKQVFKTNCKDIIGALLQEEKLSDNHYIFILKLDEERIFLSLSPEKLFKVNNGILSSEAIAGTRSRGQDENEDTRLEEELINCSKELNEHRIVAHEISKVFEATCDDFKQLSKEEVLKLSAVQHLMSRYRGKLKEGHNPFDLIKLFHPTPAVGGYPKDIAYSTIRELEGYDRGFYASPVGILSSQYSEVIVAIRSALYFKNYLHVYGGAGIVEGSDPNQEWNETQKKMNTIKEFMG